MRSILTLALKDLLMIRRDKAGLFWLIGFPTIYAIFFSSILSGDGGGPVSSLQVAVTDLAQNETSQEFLTLLASGEAVVLTPMTTEEGIDSVRRGTHLAHLTLPTDFGGGMAMMSGANFTLAIDPSRQAEGGFLEGQLMSTWFGLMRERLMDPTRARELVRENVEEMRGDENLTGPQRLVLMGFMSQLDGFLVEMESGVLSDTEDESTTAMMGEPQIEKVSIAREEPSGVPHSAHELYFPIAMIWGLMGAAAGFALTIVTEQVRGTHIRLRVAPISEAHLLAGKGLACLIACLLVMTFLLLLGHFLFGVRIEQPLHLLFALLCTSLCFVGVMMMLSTLGRTEEAVGGSSWAVMLILAMIGGLMIPRFLMPSWMQTVGNISPMKWAVQALEGAMWRQYTLPELLPVFAVLLAIGAACFAVGVVRLRALHRT